jgi:hypothetical protein
MNLIATADSLVAPQTSELVSQKIRAYHGATTDEHHRHRSWEHCYGYFRRRTPQAIAAEDAARLPGQFGAGLEE